MVFRYVLLFVLRLADKPFPPKWPPFFSSERLRPFLVLDPSLCLIYLRSLSFFCLQVFRLFFLFPPFCTEVNFYPILSFVFYIQRKWDFPLPGPCSDGCSCGFSHASLRVPVVWAPPAGGSSYSGFASLKRTGLSVDFDSDFCWDFAHVPIAGLSFPNPTWLILLSLLFFCFR